MSAQAVSIDPVAAQQAAIDASGWGRTFRLFQPRNLCSWLFIWYLMLGAIHTFRWFESPFVGVRTATVVGLVLFAIYAIPWLWFLRHIDRWTPIPGKLVLCALLWGGLTATFFLAIVANGALLSIYNKAVSATFAQDWGPALAAPFTEETAKGIGIMLLMFIAPRIIRSPFDGFVVGAFVGLGFQIVEDILYAVNNALVGFGSDQASAAIHIVIIRGLAGMFSHALFSAIFGTGLVYLIGTETTAARRLRGIGLMILAMIAHGVWDSMAALAGAVGLNVALVMFIVALVELIAILAVLRLASRSERTWMHDLLAPEVARGTMTEAELNALSGTRKDRRLFVKAYPGREQRKTVSHMLDAALDLAEGLAKSAGRETPDVASLGSEVGRVRGLPKAQLAG